MDLVVINTIQILELVVSEDGNQIELIVTGLPPTGGGGGAASWGSITGTLSNQTDLQAALDDKQDTLVSATNIKTINGSSVLGSGDLVVSGSAAWGGITGTLSNQTDLQTALDTKVNDTGDETIAGVKTFSSDPIIPDEAYGGTWDGSLEPPTKNAVYDKIETILAGSGITRIIVVTSGSITMGAATATDYVYEVAGAHTMTLPTAVGNTNRYTVKNNHSANITIDTTSAQTIDGTASIQIAPQESVDIISTGTNWNII